MHVCFFLRVYFERKLLNSVPKDVSTNIISCNTLYIYISGVAGKPESKKVSGIINSRIPFDALPNSPKRYKEMYSGQVEELMF